VAKILKKFDGHLILIKFACSPQAIVQSAGTTPNEANVTSSNFPPPSCVKKKKKKKKNLLAKYSFSFSYIYCPFENTIHLSPLINQSPSI
jgi:hypothetical protein